MNLAAAAIGFGIVAASILSLASVGFTLQFGVTNVLNLAFADTMIASAFVAYVVTDAGFNIWIGLVCALVFGATFSVVLNRLLLTPFIKRGMNLFGMVIVTLAVGLIMVNAMQAIFGSSYFSLRLRETTSYRLGPMVFSRAGVVIIFLAAVAMLLIHLLLKYTKIGKAMRATAANADLARACGIRTAGIIDLAWGVSGALGGCAGVALVLNVGSFTPTTGSEVLVAVIAAAILGGIGHAYGAMLGALVIGISSELVAALINPVYRQTVPFAILVLVLLIRPQGILSEVATRKEVVAA